MLDEFPTYQSHAMTDEERATSRRLITEVREDIAANQVWCNRLQAALDDADHWRRHAEAAEAKRGDDSELAGELNRIDDCCINAGIERKNLTVFGMVSKLADAYRSEKDRSDRLQHDNETLRAARESLEPVGWGYSTISTNASNDHWYLPDRLVSKGYRRRVYLAPPQPLEAAQ